MADFIALSPTFLNEVFKLCFLKKSFLEIVSENLKYSYIPDELSSYKHILKSISTYYQNNGKIPSYGIVSGQFLHNLSVQETITKIRDCNPSNEEEITRQLETFIKGARFELLNQKTVDLYLANKQAEAIKLLAEESTEILNFVLKSGGSKFLRIFADFENKMNNRQSAVENGSEIHEKVPFGIQELDAITYGGIDKTDLVLLVARSGIGKSTALKWTGLHATRLGYKVMHIQLEGSEEECFTKYTQTWSALPYHDLKFGEIDPAKKIKLDKVINDMLNMDKDIYVKAYEQFDEVTCIDIRNLILDYHKEKGCFPELIVLDYFNLVHPGDGIKYGVDSLSIKMKKQNVAKRLKNICVEFGTRFLTADQVSDIPMDDWNNPDFVITRSDISGDKNLTDPFSYVITLNQTQDEYKNKVMRLYVDKLRNYESGQIIKIATGYEYGRFYDRNRTEALFSKKKAS